MSVLRLQNPLFYTVLRAIPYRNNARTPQKIILQPPGQKVGFRKILSDFFSRPRKIISMKISFSRERIQDLSQILKKHCLKRK